MRTALLHGLLAGALAGLASIVYMQVYSEALAVDYSMVAKPIGAFASCMVGCLLASAGHLFFSKRVRSGTDAWFNAIFTVLTFASLIPVFGATLPLAVKYPELFYGMVVPMHLFPQLFWLTSKPLFTY